MPSIKEYNDKLKSLQNTAKMTGTMKMVSASDAHLAQHIGQYWLEFDKEIRTERELAEAVRAEAFTMGRGADS